MILAIVAPIVYVFLCVWSLFCYAVLSAFSSFATVLVGSRESWLLYFDCLPDVL